MDKSSLRRTFRSSRNNLTAGEIQSKNLLISQRLIDFVPWDQLKMVHLYLPILQQNEVDTYPLIQHLRSEKDKVHIVVPKVRPGGGLDHYFLTEHTKLASNEWGIPEPVDALEAPVDQIELVVVPMLIFDRSGHRIGYGKGYYDRFLAQCNPKTIKIGLCYFDPVPSIGSEPTDIAMDAVVTPDGVWEF